MSNAILGKKRGTTQIFDDSGNRIPVTVVEAGPCVVLDIKTPERDGYSAIKLGFDEKSEKRTFTTIMISLIIASLFTVYGNPVLLWIKSL